MSEPSALLVAADRLRPRVHGGRVANLLGRIGFRARAWTRDGVVYLAASQRRAPPTVQLALVAHEAEHVLHPFEHHAHLCGKSVPVHGLRHLSDESVGWAAEQLGKLL